MAVPRWEWRTFGETLHEAEQSIRAAGPAGSVRTSSEIYLVSQTGHDNTKIRDGLMDIKTLRRVDEHGLQLWEPVLKSGFPLQPEVFVRVLASWQVAPPAGELVELSQEQLVQGFVPSVPGLRAVGVDKTRHAFTVEDCIVEVADLLFDGQPIRTVAVEHADPALVWRVVEQLGLSRHANLSYLAALKQRLGW